MSASESKKVEGWRSRQRREHDELLQAVRKRAGAFYLLEDGEAIIRVQGEHANTVGRKGRKRLYLRNETGVQELKQSSALRRSAYQVDWARRKRAANPELNREEKRMRLANPS